MCLISSLDNKIEKTEKDIITYKVLSDDYTHICGYRYHTPYMAHGTELGRDYREKEFVYNPWNGAVPDEQRYFRTQRLKEDDGNYYNHVYGGGYHMFEKYSDAVKVADYLHEKRKEWNSSRYVVAEAVIPKGTIILRGLTEEHEPSIVAKRVKYTQILYATGF